MMERANGRGAHTPEDMINYSASLRGRKQRLEHTELRDTHFAHYERLSPGYGRDDWCGQGALGSEKIIFRTWT